MLALRVEKPGIAPLQNRIAARFPNVSIFDREQREIVMLGQDRRTLVFRVRTHAAYLPEGGYAILLALASSAWARRKSWCPIIIPAT